MIYEVLDKGSPVGRFEVRENNLISGKLPDFLEEATRSLDGQSLEEYVEYYCNGMANQYELANGYGIQRVAANL